MKVLLFIASGMLFLAIADLPIGYYTIVRFVATITAVVVFVSEFQNRITLWMIIFGLIAIVFNPIIPVYLHNKDLWMIIDFFAGIMFLIKALTINKDCFGPLNNRTKL
ncbi:DUF6804 family protein [Lentimicrobium sp. S6]|uniref:DUF6804 family protein n=1 Tax=Lentimicrobium sp. S6 TaxID=2735872 RepID=UPI001555E1C5|nr:DUF6804 family protein [Lentimicrobium sp. S6]NPD47248.1 hypothetical protein [Lentimicrobium sp. S6]